MPFPDITSCLICEFVRDEGRGKMTLLGFAGAAPNVTLYVADIPATLHLAIVLTAGPGAGGENYSFEVAPEASGALVAHTPLRSAKLTKTKPSVFALQVHSIFPVIGRYKIRLLVDGKEHYQTTFELAQGQAPD